MNTKVMFSSNSCEWETPIDLFQKLNSIYKFDCDVCATKENAKCSKYFTKENDGLKQDWKGTCWMNPPYGREIYKWVQKAYESSKNGATVVCLLPARTDTKWFHDYVYNNAQIEFIKGRIKFGESKNSAPFPSMIAIFATKAVRT